MAEISVFLVSGMSQAVRSKKEVKYRLETPRYFLVPFSRLKLAEFKSIKNDILFIGKSQNH